MCKNSGDTIGRTLRSINNQDYPDLEHIVIDGGSTDRTLEIIQSHRHRSLTLCSERDDGIYDAMNKGINLATGEIICFLNGDDFYAHEGVIKKVVRKISTDSLDMLLTDVIIFDVLGGGIQRRYSSSRFDRQSLSWGWMPAHPGAFIRSSLIDKVGGFDPKFKIAGDYDLFCKIIQRSGLRYSHSDFITVYMKSGGASSSGLKSLWTLNREVLIACRQNNIDTNLLKILSKYPRKLFEFRFRRNIITR